MEVHAQGLHQGQGLGVGTDQDVLTVVHTRPPGQINGSGASAECACHLKDADLVSCLNRIYRSSQARPACADNSDFHQRPRQLVRIAIHNLRSGVSEVRWCSTRKSSASISRNKVR